MVFDAPEEDVVFVTGGVGWSIDSDLSLWKYTLLVTLGIKKAQTAEKNIPWKLNYFINKYVIYVLIERL